MYVPWTTFLRLLICLNETKRGSGVWYHISSYCKYSEENCSSQGELTEVIKYAALCRITGLASYRRGSSHCRVEFAKSELMRMKVRKLRTWYLETRADLRHQTICLIFSVLQTEMETQTATGLGEKKVPGTNCSRWFRWKSGFCASNSWPAFCSLSVTLPRSSLITGAYATHTSYVIRPEQLPPMTVIRTEVRKGCLYSFKYGYLSYKNASIHYRRPLFTPGAMWYAF